MNQAADSKRSNRTGTLIFRGHKRLAIDPHWSDFSSRGTVRLEHKTAKFWMDISRDVGGPSEEDPREILLMSYLVTKPPPGIIACLSDPLTDRAKLKAALRGSRNGLGSFPREYADYLINVAHQLSELSSRLLLAALWRTGTRGGTASVNVHPALLSWVPMQKNVASDAWKRAPVGVITLGLPDVSSFDLNSEMTSKISLLVDSGMEQPLGHDLLREAWRIRESNPRSALVIAVAAVEVGVKEFIATQLPQTEWLLQNLSSPPLRKLLRDLLPTVPSRAVGHDFVPPLDRAVVAALHEAAERRNSMVHAGKAAFEEHWLSGIFRHVRDLLYQLDYHSGHEWALGVAESVTSPDHT